jgi:hypothetical protein
VLVCFRVTRHVIEFSNSKTIPTDINSTRVVVVVKCSSRKHVETDIRMSYASPSSSNEH